jgi:hypothetical protein
VDLIVFGMKVYKVRKGDPKLLLEVTQRREGVAFVTQSIGNHDLTYEITLVSPVGNASIYRLGLHLFDDQQGKYFGVWGLDFDPEIPLQNGYLHLDLRTRVAEGKVDDEVIPVDSGSFDIKTGDIEVQAVWWKLDAPSYVALYRSARFIQDENSQIVFKQYRDIPPTILGAP